MKCFSISALLIFICCDTQAQTEVQKKLAPIAWQNAQVVLFAYGDDIPASFPYYGRASNGSITNKINGDIASTRKSKWNDMKLVVDSMSYTEVNGDWKLEFITHTETDYTLRNMYRTVLSNTGDTLEKASFEYDTLYRLVKMNRVCKPTHSNAKWQGEKFELHYGEQGYLSEVHCFDRKDSLLRSEYFLTEADHDLPQEVENKARKQQFTFLMQGDSLLFVAIQKYGQDKYRYHSVLRYFSSDTLVTITNKGNGYKGVTQNDCTLTKYFHVNSDWNHTYLVTQKLIDPKRGPESESRIEMYHSPPKGESWTLRFYEGNTLKMEVFEDGLGK